MTLDYLELRAISEILAIAIKEGMTYCPVDDKFVDVSSLKDDVDIMVKEALQNEKRNGRSYLDHV